MIERPADILLVEDNDHDRELALHVLRKQGLTSAIKALRDGVEALDYLLGRGEYAGRPPTVMPRVVLLDLKLPKVDGIEVLRVLKSEPSTKRIPIVAFTSSRQLTDVSAAYSLGVNSYVVKPVDFQQYSATVRAIVSYWLHHNLDLTRAGAVV
jgi:CheY-like chemotaxis protein